MREGEVIYIMYNGVNSGTPSTLLFSGKEQGKKEWISRHRNNTLPKYIELWVNKDQFITSSFLIGFLEEFAKGKTHRELVDKITIKITPSIPEPQDRKYVAELNKIIEDELRRAMVRLVILQGNNNETR